MGNRFGKNDDAPERRFAAPTGIYETCPWELKQIKSMITSKKIAPCFPPADTSDKCSVECPICFFNFPACNRTRCCGKYICSECYLQVRKPDLPRTKCPFCNAKRFEVSYSGPKTEQEIAEEEREAQIQREAQDRMLAEERARDEERRKSPSQERKINLADYGLTERDVTATANASVASSSSASSHSGSRHPARRSERSERSERADRTPEERSARRRRTLDPDAPLTARVTNIPNEYSDYIPATMEVPAWTTDLSLNYEELMLEEAIRQSLRETQPAQSQSQSESAETTSVSAAVAAAFSQPTTDEMSIDEQKRIAKEWNGADINTEDMEPEEEEEFIVMLAMALSLSEGEHGSQASAASAGSANAEASAVPDEGRVSMEVAADAALPTVVPVPTDVASRDDSVHPAEEIAASSADPHAEPLPFLLAEPEPVPSAEPVNVAVSDAAAVEGVATDATSAANPSCVADSDVTPLAEPPVSSSDATLSSPSAVQEAAAEESSNTV
jgi:hypothetical protein